MHRKTYYNLSQLFGGYFNQDYDVIIKNFDRNKPTIPQLAIGCKNENPQEFIQRVIPELESLISQHYTANLLEEILEDLGLGIDIERLGYSPQQFLIEVLKLLKE